MRWYVIILVLLISCSEAKLDATNQESYKESLEGMKQNLSDEKAAKVDSSLKIIGLDKIQETDNIFSAMLNQNMQDNMIKSLDDKTADDIISMADSIIDAKHEKLRENALAEIKRLNKKKKSASRAQQRLNNFVVENSRVYHQEDMFSNRLVFEIQLRNNTNYAISKIEAEASVHSAGREIPWHQDKFNYSIDGGIEPDESKTLKLSPNMFSGWSDIPDRDDLLLAIEITDLYGSGEKLITEANFTGSDQARLKILKDVYQD